LNGGELPLLELEQLYYKNYGEQILLADGTTCANKSVLGVLRTASHVLYLKGRGAVNCSVCINRNFLSSLKDLKPDLFIPAETNKIKKRNNGHHVRSLSLSRNGTFDTMPKNYGGKTQVESSVVDKPVNNAQEKTIPIPKTNNFVIGAKKTVRALSVDETTISAASTPPDSNGICNVKRAQSSADSRVNVLIAGSGNLKQFGISIPSPRLPFSAPLLVKSQVQVLAKVEAAGPEIPSPCRRSRLAANFGALPKNE